MQYVGIYDKNGYVAEQIKSMKFWSVRNDFELTEIIHDKNGYQAQLCTSVFP